AGEVFLGGDLGKAGWAAAHVPAELDHQPDAVLTLRGEGDRAAAVIDRAGAGLRRQDAAAGGGRRRGRGGVGRADRRGQGFGLDIRVISSGLKCRSRRARASIDCGCEPGGASSLDTKTLSTRGPPTIGEPIMDEALTRLGMRVPDSALARRAREL